VNILDERKFSTELTSSPARKNNFATQMCDLFAVVNHVAYFSRKATTQFTTDSDKTDDER